jgi:hypothetical protein
VSRSLSGLQPFKVYCPMLLLYHNLKKGGRSTTSLSSVLIGMKQMFCLHVWYCTNKHKSIIPSQASLQYLLASEGCSSSDDLKDPGVRVLAAQCHALLGISKLQETSATRVSTTSTTLHPPTYWMHYS